MLEWQVGRQAYAAFLKEFQEYFDRVTTQQQLDWAGTARGHAYFSKDEPHLQALWNKETELSGIEATLENIRGRIEETYGLLTQRGTSTRRT